MEGGWRWRASGQVEIEVADLATGAQVHSAAARRLRAGNGADGGRMMNKHQNVQDIFRMKSGLQRLKSGWVIGSPVAGKAQVRRQYLNA